MSLLEFVSSVNESEMHLEKGWWKVLALADVANLASC